MATRKRTLIKVIILGGSGGVAFYRGADCCVLVYDVNVMKSFFLSRQNLLVQKISLLWFLEIKQTLMMGTAKWYLKGKPRHGEKAKATFLTLRHQLRNVDAAFQCIAKNALKNETDEEIYLLDTIDLSPGKKFGIKLLKLFWRKYFLWIDFPCKIG
ncbi:hypothetical protein L7F22_044937 [Adiantum nelumboides]|nr:hypothetical protein [Adiantum nelumboides]